MGIRYALYRPFESIFSRIYKWLGIEKKIEKRLINIHEVPTQLKNTIVLGAKIHYEVTEILSKRLDLAIQVYNKYPDMNLILSGTPKISRFNSDVDVMRDYILSNSDINPEQLMLDYNGTTTFNSFKSLRDNNYSGRLLIITNRFHMARSLYIATELGIDAYGLKYDDESGNVINSKTLKSKIFLRDREVVATFKAFIQCKLYKIMGN